jgi:hypothetical protein
LSTAATSLASQLGSAVDRTDLDHP